MKNNVENVLFDSLDLAFVVDVVFFVY